MINIVKIFSPDKHLSPEQRMQSHEVLELGGSDSEAVAFSPGTSVVQRGGQTWPAGFVQFGPESR